MGLSSASPSVHVDDWDISKILRPNEFDQQFYRPFEKTAAALEDELSNLRLLPVAISEQAFVEILERIDRVCAQGPFYIQPGRFDIKKTLHNIMHTASFLQHRVELNGSADRVAQIKSHIREFYQRIR